MNTTRLVEIATELGQLYQQRATLALRKWQYENDRNAREFALRPEPDLLWPGKNDAERKLAAERAHRADEAWIKISQQIGQTEFEISNIEPSILMLEAERRALEWEIRGELVRALQANHLEYSGAVEESAFDEALDASPWEYTPASDEIPF